MKTPYVLGLVAILMLALLHSPHIASGEDNGSIGVFSVISKTAIVSWTYYGKSLIVYSYTSNGNLYTGVIDVGAQKTAYAQITADHLLVLPIPLGDDYLVAYTVFSTLYIGRTGSGEGVELFVSNPRVMAAEKVGDNVYIVFDTRDGMLLTIYYGGNDTYAAYMYPGFHPSKAAIIGIGSGDAYIAAVSEETGYYIHGDTAYTVTPGGAAYMINGSRIVYGEIRGDNIYVADTGLEAGLSIPVSLDKLYDIIIHKHGYILVGEKSGSTRIIVVDSEAGVYREYNITVTYGTSMEPLEYIRSYPVDAGASLIYASTSTDKVAMTSTVLNASRLGEIGLYFAETNGYRATIFYMEKGRVAPSTYNEPAKQVLERDEINLTATTITGIDINSGGVDYSETLIQAPELVMVEAPPAAMSLETYNVTGIRIVYDLKIAGLPLGGYPATLEILIDNNTVLTLSDTTDYTNGRVEFTVTSGQLPITGNTTIKWRITVLGLEATGTVFIYKPPEQQEQQPVTGGGGAAGNQTTNQTTGGTQGGTTGNQTQGAGGGTGGAGGAPTSGGEAAGGEAKGETGGGIPLLLIGAVVVIVVIAIAAFLLLRR